MRLAPTFGYLAIPALLLACAAPPAKAAPVPEEESDSNQPSTSSSTRTDSPSPSASFEPAFQTPPAPTTTTPTTSTNLSQCIDNGDPGGAENVATQLPATDDCDDDLKTISGIAKGAVDIDFYKLSATDRGPSFTHPFGCRTNTEFQAETAGTELCVFARCKNATADAVTGCDGGTLTTSDTGMKGCCAAAPGHAVPKWDCSGFGDDDSADFFLRVKQVDGDKCLPYTVKYRF